MSETENGGERNLSMSEWREISRKYGGEKNMYASRHDMKISSINENRRQRRQHSMAIYAKR